MNLIANSLDIGKDHVQRHLTYTNDIRECVADETIESNETEQA